MDVVSDDTEDGAADLGFCVPAASERLHQLRQALIAWARRVGLAAEAASDLVLATYEAMANVVDHAYRGRSNGLLDLQARADRTRRTVTVTVTDYGRWRPPTQGPTLRGRGLALIRGLAQHTEIRPGRHGTTVAMTYRLA
ncbi:ATP-binding protein [Actinophytocola sp.]|uniref:ATP-binding protein n=1 Tax=Actinophytocola sp. TaxID=1872138 RepID=UPI002D3F7B0B|nr:ATP-binding protein [Actinophytocola sp.]HYQ67325.1 ATP-binding protein [Actinophytocola sp.]